MPENGGWEESGQGAVISGQWSVVSGQGLGVGVHSKCSFLWEGEAPAELRVGGLLSPSWCMEVRVACGFEYSVGGAVLWVLQR